MKTRPYQLLWFWKWDSLPHSSCPDDRKYLMCKDMVRLAHSEGVRLCLSGQDLDSPLQLLSLLFHTNVLATLKGGYHLIKLLLTLSQN